MKIIKFTLPFLSLLFLSSCSDEIGKNVNKYDSQKSMRKKIYRKIYGSIETINKDIGRLEDNINDSLDNVVQQLENVKNTKTIYKIGKKPCCSPLAALARLSTLVFGITAVVGICINPIVTSTSILGVSLIGLLISIPILLIFK